MKNEQDFEELTAPPGFKANIPTLPISKKLKGVIMTSSIDSSVWAALFAHKVLKANVLLVRTNDIPVYYFAADKYQNVDFDKTIQFEEFKEKNIGETSKNYLDFIDETEIIVSTYQRMKEGFSCENLVWGIVACFPYSELTRVQICGRIRRSSQDEDIIHAKRILFTNSSKVPSNMFTAGGKYNKFATETYSWKFENYLFQQENINYISNHKALKE